MVHLTMYMHTTSHYRPLNSETTDGTGVVDINVKYKHSLIAGNIVRGRHVTS